MTACRGCGAAHTRAIGTLPPARSFAGVERPGDLPGGLLRDCPDCGFVGRYPVLEQTQYDSLYRTGSSTVWASTGEVRRDFDRVVDELLRSGPGTILDIGCYTGDLLARLPATFLRHGIEPSLAAAQIARERGIEIVAPSLDALPPEARFRYITACDVIEHVIDPLAFLARAARHLEPGGRFIITTGNAHSWLWRLCGASFWYCQFPEHVSFLSPAWLRRRAAAAGLSVVGTQRFNYRFARATPRAVVVAVAALFNAWLPGLYRRVRYGNVAVPVTAVPGCGGSKDHVMCVLQLVASREPSGS